MAAFIQISKNPSAWSVENKSTANVIDPPFCSDSVSQNHRIKLLDRTPRDRASMSDRAEHSQLKDSQQMATQLLRINIK